MSMKTRRIRQPEDTIASGDGTKCARRLDERIADVVADVKASPIWNAICSSDAALIRALIREVYWEVHCYHPYTTKTGFAMLGRIGPGEMKTLRTLLLHKWEEVEHRVWALDGYRVSGEPRQPTPRFNWRFFDRGSLVHQDECPLPRLRMRPNFTLWANLYRTEREATSYFSTASRPVEKK